MPAIAVLAAAAAAWCVLQVESRHLEALEGGAGPNGNFLDNDQWLSTVSQYDRDKYWNRFRDGCRRHSGKKGLASSVLSPQKSRLRSLSQALLECQSTGLLVFAHMSTAGSVGCSVYTPLSSGSGVLSHFSCMVFSDILVTSAPAGVPSLCREKPRNLHKNEEVHMDDYFRNWNPNKPFDQALDPSKDPCLRVKCSPHKVCVTQDYQTALCVSRKHLLPRQKKENVAHKHWVGPSNLVKCKPCPVAQSAMVCGSDGHTYTSKCKMEFHACSTGKSLTTLCDGPCPCLPEPEPPKHKAEKNACTDKELRNLASRLKDWFGALHEDANRVIKPTSPDAAQGRFDTSILPICKDSLGWMFNKLDMNYDLLLDHSEINAIYLEKYEPCIKPLFNSCDSFKDGKLSNNEWCYCFQKPAGLPCQNEMNRIQKLSRGKSLLGTFTPRCNEDGYYKATQCHGSTGQCWCVDKYGNELAGSRKQGAVSCEEEQETSGDFGSGGAVVLLDDLEDERELGPEDRLRKLRVRARALTEDDEDEDDDKEDEAGYIW